MKSVVAEINDKFASAFSGTHPAPRKPLEASDLSVDPSNLVTDIGCLGEVQLYDEDVDPQKWAIKILVSFRKGTEMVELSGQRQSGGVGLLFGLETRQCCSGLISCRCAGTVVIHDHVLHQLDEGFDGPFLSSGRDQSRHGRPERARDPGLAGQVHLRRRCFSVSPAIAALNGSVTKR